MDHRTIIEPFKIKVVEPLPLLTRGERERLLVAAGYNLFAVPAKDVTFDFLTDSGTTAMSAAQWGAMMIYRKHGIPFVLDACRFAENAWFIKRREPGQAERPVRQIAADVFATADGCLVSAKKDGMVNIGGFIALATDAWLPKLRAMLILTEGFPTYGGLAARDLEAVAIGLDEALDERYLAYREAVSRYMADGLNRAGVPTVQPPGGHAVYRARSGRASRHDPPATTVAVRRDP